MHSSLDKVFILEQAWTWRFSRNVAFKPDIAAFSALSGFVFEAGK